RGVSVARMLPRRPSPAVARVAVVGKAADWLREERRNVLGHWTAFCVECGAARRWFVDCEDEVPETCACGGTMLRRCPACAAPFSSTFAVECEECGAKLREPELLGMRIRREQKK